MSHGRTVARNAAWLMVATIGQKAISFLTFTFAARFVGVETTGRYFFAVSVTSVFVTLADLGLTPVVIREMAGDDERGKAVFKKAVFAKLILIPIAVGASLLYGGWRVTNPETLLALVLACFVMSADALSLLWYGVLRGKRQLRFEALGMFLGQILTGITTLLAVVVFRAGAPGLVIGLLAASLWNVGWSMVQVHRLKADPKSKVRVGWKELAAQALPFALAGIFVKIYSYIDTLILKETHGEEGVGNYAVAYKVTYALQFLPLAFVAALYPGMSAAHASKDRKGLEQMLVGSLRLMMIVAAPIAAALSALAPRLITVVYGSGFVGSIAPLQILPWVLIPIFLDFPIGSLLNATHRAYRKTFAMGVAMVLNAALNFLLVPSMGPVGAAISAIGSFWMLFFVGAWFVRNDVVDRMEIFWLFAKGILVAGVLWGLLSWLLSIVSFIVLLFVSPFIALILLISTRLMGWQDVHLVLSWLKRKASGAVSAPENHD